MAKLIGRGQYTLVHLHDGKGMQMYLTCDQPTTQHFSLTNRTFTPDYAKTPITIVPEVYFSGSTKNQIEHIKNLVWKINDAPPIQYGGVINGKSLVLNKNLTIDAQLKITLSCVVVDPDNLQETKLNAHTCLTKQDNESYTPILSLVTPNGALFKNEIHDHLTAVCKLSIGSINLSDNLIKTWYVQKDNGLFEKVIDGFYAFGQGTDTLTVSVDYVTGEKTFKCEIEYEGSIYTEFVTFSRQTDPYLLEIENKNGDKMKNGQGVIYCEAHINRAGVRIPDVKAEAMFNFQWKKYNKYTGAEDLNWRNPNARAIELNKNDIDTLSTFMCVVTAKNGGFPYTLPLILK